MQNPVTREKTASRPFKAFNAIVPVIGVITVCAIALYHGRAPTLGAGWPYLYDALRDVGTAQMILDGRYPEDPIFLGETLWFNPLVGAIVAAGSWISGLRPPEASVHLGPYLNLLIPLAFFLLAAVLFDRWTASAALVFFVFGNSRDGNLWTIATYSPWLFAPHFAQSLFCLTLLFYWKARQTDRWIGYALAGLLLGLTFMGHAGPAVVAGLLILLTTSGRLWRIHRNGLPREELRRTLLRFLVLVGCALGAGAPYLYSVLWHYHLHMINSFPSLYTDKAAQLSHVPELLRGALSLSGALAVAGLVAILVNRRSSYAARWILGWLCIVLALLAQTYLWQWSGWAREQIPQIVPGHHWLIAWSLLKAVLCGYGLIALSQLPMCLYHLYQGHARLGQNRDSPCSGTREDSPGFAWPRTLCAAAAVLMAGGVLYGAYPAWAEFVGQPRERVTYPYIYDDRAHVYNWILEHTDPSDVFLCDDQLGLIAVMPSARKVVGTMLIFANPYVDSLRRFAEREAMFDAMRAKDRERFDRLAAAYHVTFILTQGKETQLVEASTFPHLTEAFQSGLLHVYRVGAAGGPGSDLATRKPKS